MEHVKVVINNVEFSIPLYLKERCEKFNVDIYGEYADKITNIHCPHMKTRSYSLNVFNAFYEKIYKTKYGPFVQLLNNRIIDQSYELYDLLKNDPDKKYNYDFLYFFEKGMIPNQEKYLFYGTEIKRINYPNIENEPRPYMLDDLIKANLKYVKKLAKGKQNVYEADLKWRCFEMCRRLHDWYTGFLPKDYQEKISLDQYQTTLKKLINRYSFNENTLFQKVEKIDNYKINVGVYVLCIETKRMIYVGQATVSLRNRIIQHINQKHTGFDHSILPSEIKEIYVLTTPPDLELIDKIEADGIATVDMKTPQNANVAASSFSIETINEEVYNASNYLLNDETLQKYIKRINLFEKRTRKNK